MDTGKQERLPTVAPETMIRPTPARRQPGPPAFLVMNEFGWRQVFGEGPDRPVSVVKIELGGYSVRSRLATNRRRAFTSRQ